MELASDTTGICQAYTGNMAPFDEMCSSHGIVKPHWQYLMDALQKLGSTELIERSLETRRQLRESGVTYNLHGGAQGENRPWQLDPIPFVIDSKEWADIEAGLIQRAELLNLILKDLYGPRELIQKKLLPAELVFAHDGFLRACDAMPTNLLSYATDLARGEDGQFWVLGDRTQTPSGAGYALENRTIMRRILPSLFRDAQVHRLALFFRSMRNELSAISPNPNQSRTVLLTPGPQIETYFEHSYLASYLGYALVQGNDLTSRSGKIWLKSLDGLQPVDVILRRVNDQLCDPLELKQDSIQGVPGLVEAARRGHITVSNSLGSSLLENPALQAFLPNICQHLFGQDLRLPSIATWWCGRHLSLKYVMENFEQLIIKPIAKHRGIASVLPAELESKERDQLRAKILENPHLYAAQERIRYSTSPTLINGQLQPRAAILRTFLTASENSYRVMPGGLTRVIDNQSNWQISSDSEVISKDTWVLASEPERQVSLWSRSQPQEDYTGIGSLPSRAADNLYWLGRNAERAEDFIRLFRSITTKLDEISEYQDDADKQCLQILLQAIDNLTLMQNNLVINDSDRSQINIDDKLLQMLLDLQKNGSLHGTLNSMVGSAYSVRDLLSPDTWRVISNIETALKAWQLQRPHSLTETTDELDDLITTLAAFSGLLLESTTADQGWLFLNIGRRLERARWLIGLIRAILVYPQPQYIEDPALESLLASSECLMTYRRRYRAHLKIQTVLELLLLDQNNPRSLRFQLDRLQQAITVLPRAYNQFELSMDQRYILEATTLLQLSDLDKLCLVNETTQIRTDLEQLLSRTSQLLQNISQVITEIYFNHTVTPQQLTQYPET